MRGDLDVVFDPEAIQRTYSEAAFHDRAARLLPSLHEFFERCHGVASDVPVLRAEPGPDPRGLARRVAGDGLRRLGVRR